MTEATPVQIVWGTKDVVVPARHAWMAHSAMPGSRLEIFEGSGHFPFHDDPARFIDVVQRFVDSTQPAEHDQAALRELLRTGGGERTVTGAADTFNSSLHNSLGAVYCESGRCSEAIPHFQRAIELAPSDPEYHTNLGNAFGFMGRLAEARAQLERALALAPDYAPARASLAHLEEVERGAR